MTRFHFPFVALVAAVFVPVAAQSQGDQIAYVGTYTTSASKGIYAFWMDSKTGKMTPIGLVAEVTNPSFLAIHPNRKYLYAVSEIADFQGQKVGAVSAFRIEPATGKLTLLNAVQSKGAGPCFVSADKTGKNVLVANYGGGSVAVLPIDAEGKLKEASSFVQHTGGSGANPKRQAGPHAHSINLSADNRFAIAADLGLDQVLVYKFDAGTGTVSPNDPPSIKMAPGSGPRHFAFHPKGKYAYVINELLSTVTAMSWDEKKGEFKELHTITTLPANFAGANNSTAEVQVHPSGKFLYGSNRGHDSIAVFSIDPGKGTLTPVDHTPTQGNVPRNFGIDVTGNFLVAGNQRTNNMVVFRIDQKTGKLTPTGQTLEVGAPVCIRFMKAN